jgi:gamma-glutamylputrescine oxidase
MERSYYAATANEFASAPKLEGEVTADVVVIGGGYTGLHAALNAAERGFSVVVLEAGRVGWGASGRNGGQMIPGWRKGAGELIETFGKARAKALFDLALEARSLTIERIEKHAIDCDLRLGGHLTLAAKPADLAWMRGEADRLADSMGYDLASVISADDARWAVDAPNFHGALLDAGGGHLHPLNYALGLADAARAVGVQLFENSRVERVETANGVTARTEGGVVCARFGVMACDALLGDLDPRLAGRIMPVANYLIATAPLSESVIRGNLAVSDSRFVVNYFRLSADGRLIFGGGERYTPEPPADRPLRANTWPVCFRSSRTLRLSMRGAGWSRLPCRAFRMLDAGAISSSRTAIRGRGVAASADRQSAGGRCRNGGAL